MFEIIPLPHHEAFLVLLLRIHRIPGPHGRTCDRHRSDLAFPLLQRTGTTSFHKLRRRSVESYSCTFEPIDASLQNSVPHASGPIFERWHRAYRPNADDAKALNDTVKAVYDLFHDYFAPLLRIPSGPDTTYRYAIIQSNIRFYVMEDSSFRNKIENCQYPDWIEITHASTDKPYSTISNFRPELKDPDLKTLYPNQAYRAALLSF